MNLNRNPWLFLLVLLLSAIILLLACDPSASVGRQLDRLDLVWELDPEGDYRVAVPLGGSGTEAAVGIGAHSIRLSEKVRVREIWSVAARIPGDLPEELAENLMADSWSSRKLGSWAMAGTTTDGRIVLVYLTRIPAEASQDLLEAAILDAADSATSMGVALADLEIE